MAMRVVAGTLVALLTVEACSYLAARWLARIALVYVPSGTDGFTEYLAWRDPELGWPSPQSFGRGERDARGARVVPETERDAPECGAAYGDSFTFGDEVCTADAYPSALGRALGCRVVNFGVGGYGTDQALLRYRRHPTAAGQFVVLGHYSEDIVRNVNQLRDLHSGGRFGLKPRFILRNGALVPVPLPEPRVDDLERIVDGAAEVLPYEYFLPGGDAGIVPLRFPFTYRMAQLPGHYRLRAWRQGVPSYQPFYAADHPSGAFAITLAILLAFDREARTRGETPLVLLIPDIADLWELRKGRSLPYAPLAAALRANGVDPLDAGLELARRLGGRDPCDIYTKCGRGHLTPEGNAMVAALVARRLRELGVAPLAGGNVIPHKPRGSAAVTTIANTSEAHPGER